MENQSFKGKKGDFSLAFLGLAYQKVQKIFYWGQKENLNADIGMGRKTRDPA